MSELVAALAGGAVGSVLTATFTQFGRARLAWAEVELHDDEAAERQQQLVVWADDTTQQLVREMAAVTQEHAGRNTVHSSIHATDLAALKSHALHRYRDQEWEAQLFLAQLQASEGPWHLLARRLRHRPFPTVDRTEVEPFLTRWREPVTRHGSGAPDEAGVRILDRTTRTTAEALAELPSLPLT